MNIGAVPLNLPPGQWLFGFLLQGKCELFKGDTSIVELNESVGKRAVVRLLYIHFDQIKVSGVHFHNADFITVLLGMSIFCDSLVGVIAKCEALFDQPLSVHGRFPALVKFVQDAPVSPEYFVDCAHKVVGIAIGFVVPG